MNEMGKLLYYLFGLLFLVFAGLQYNDPDPLIWILVYLFPAICSVLAARGKLNYLVVGVGFLGYLFLLTQNFPSPEHLTFDHEEGREAFGLILCGNYVAILGIAKLYNESYR